MCGTAFSWITGNIEQGIIHNPHAHAFFQNNPDALNNYMNHNNNNNNCRNPIPGYQQLYNVINHLDQTVWKRIEAIYRHISEFRQYRRVYYINYINDNDENNEDIRYKYLYNEIDDKHFKSMLHARNKKISLRKAIYEIIISTTEIIENYLWSIVDINTNVNYNNEKKCDETQKILQILDELKNNTNKITENIYLEHNYKSQEIFTNTFYIIRI